MPEFHFLGTCHSLDILLEATFGSHVDLGHSLRTEIERRSKKPEVDGSTPDLTTIPSERAKLVAS